VDSPHTALDAADGGTGDALAELCDATPVGPLDCAPAPGSDAEVKLTTFVPKRDVERVANALFAAGAGRIGLYERCSFRIPGAGSFFGTDETNPVVGDRGRMEFVEEIRLELVCATDRLPEAVAALRKAHPYEEPAFDVYALAAKPTSVGIGRLAELKRSMTLRQLAARLAAAVGAPNAQIAGNPRRKVRRLAILVGSAGRVHEDFPRAAEADVFVTGEIRHHDALTIASRGGAAIALGHWRSERPVLKRLAASLKRALRGMDVKISRADRDPFQSVTSR
ncbi:MAG: Nif3-like dinuclear metal center hexameric protein, partial [Phycisphaerae bacterium]